MRVLQEPSTFGSKQKKKTQRILEIQIRVIMLVLEMLQEVVKERDVFEAEKGMIVRRCDTSFRQLPPNIQYRR
jgi:hypothetical protein